MKLRLISNWRSALRMLSVQISSLGATVATTYATFYPQLKEHVPAEVMLYVVGVTFALTIIGRLIDQGIDK